MSTTALHGGTLPLAALTTTFTPPCSTTYLLTTTKVPSQYPSFPTGGPSSCVPPQWPENIAGEGFQYYSPAVCPEGFTVGENCQINNPRTAQGFPPIASTETAMYCAPTGFTCTSDTSDYRGGVWAYTTFQSATVLQVTLGPVLQIRWAESDLSSLTAHPTTTTSQDTDTTSVSQSSATTDSTYTSKTVETSLSQEPRPGVSTSTSVVQTSSTLSTPALVTTFTSADGIRGIEPFSFVDPVSVTPAPNQASMSSSSINTTTSTMPNTNNPNNEANTTSIPSVNSSMSDSDVTSTTATTTPSASGIGGRTILNLSTTTTVIIILISLVWLVTLGALFLMLDRRHRAGRLAAAAREESLESGRTPTPDGASMSGQNPAGEIGGHLAGATSAAAGGGRTECGVDAEADTEYAAAELGPGPPRGTCENPAEMDGTGLDEAPLSRPWSWMSRLLAPSWRSASPTLGRAGPVAAGSRTSGGSSASSKSSDRVSGSGSWSEQFRRRSWGWPRRSRLMPAAATPGPSAVAAEEKSPRDEWDDSDDDCELRGKEGGYYFDHEDRSKEPLPPAAAEKPRDDPVTSGHDSPEGVHAGARNPGQGNKPLPDPPKNGGSTSSWLRKAVWDVALPRTKPSGKAGAARSAASRPRPRSAES